MRDVSAKIKTLRVATAKATLVVSPETIRRIQTQDIPKGDPLPVAKVAAIQAAKNCSQIIPYCHPLPIDYVGVEFNLIEAAIEISVTIKAVYKTGVEMEALTAASVAALTIYDMTKMLDEAMVLKDVVLVSKTGGKSDFKERSRQPLQVGILVLSDTVAQGVKQDRSGKLIEETIQQINTPDCPLEVAAYQVVSDSPEEIEKALLHFSDTLQLDLVLTTGGTGMSPRDNTPEVMSRVIERDVPGIVETLRSYGQERMPYAMLSRGRAGVRGKTLMVNLPGSYNGVKESLDALFPSVFHAFKMLKGASHPEKKPRDTHSKVLEEIPS